jgi:hypothetical protein
MLVSSAALPAFAGQLAEPLRVDVPFIFTAGNQTLPAGSYLIVQNDMHVVTLLGNGKSVTLVGTAGSGATGNKTSLSFDHTSKGYILKAVNNNGIPSTLLLKTR